MQLRDLEGARSDRRDPLRGALITPGVCAPLQVSATVAERVTGSPQRSWQLIAGMTDQGRMGPSTFRKLVFSFAVPLLCAIPTQGCSSDDTSKSEPGDEIEVVPFPSTKMLSAEDLSSLEPDAGDGRLVFRQPPKALENVGRGAVIVGGASKATPNGFLRVVLDAERTGEGLLLRTAIAPPQLAFKKLHARVARPVSLDDGPLVTNDTTTPLGIGGTSERKAPVNVVLFDGDGDPSTTNDQLRIEGSFSGAVAYNLSLDVDWGDIFDLPAAVTSCVESLAGVIIGKKPSCSLEDMLPEVKVAFTVDPSVASELRFVGQASLAFEKKFEIATVHLPPLILGPLVFLPTLDIIASVEGGASASFRAGVKGHVALTSSVAVSSKTAGRPVFSPPAVKDTSFDVEEPEVGLHAHAKTKAGVRLGMALYGAAGPYVTAEASLGLVADPERSPCWELRSGLSSRVGARITSPNLPVLGHVTLLDWSSPPFEPLDIVVASGSCKDPPAGSSHLPPGSGPDAPALRSPAFEPWSSLHEAGISDGASSSGPALTGIVFTDLSRAIDDRWVVAASEARALLKIDDAGNRIWSARYLTPTGTPLGIVRSVPTRDAGIAVLASDQDGSSFELLRVGQAGGVAFRRSYKLPFEICATPAARVLANDGPGGAGTGFLVAGECLSQDKAFVVHLDDAGAVIDAGLWAAPNGGASGLSPRAITRTGTNGELVLVGEVRGTSAGDGMFVARLDDAGALRSARGYAGCQTAFNLSPTSVIPAESGGITVAGGSHSQSRAFVARIRENGDVGFVTYPGFANGRAPVFVASAIAELPTSGFVMSASSVELTGEGDATVPAIALVGLDASGRPVWTKRYAPGAARASSFAALRLTTDGGALVTGLATGDAGASSIWAMKAFAKDGGLGKAAVVATTPTLDDGPSCSVQPFAFAPSVTELDVVAETRAVRVEKR